MISRIASRRQRKLYRAICMLLVAALVALPAHGAAESRPAACQRMSGFVSTHTASADAEFIKAAAADTLSPIGASAALLDDGSSLVTSVAKGLYQPERSGAMFFRRDAMYAPGSTVPGMVADFKLGMDPDRDVLWARVRLSVPGNSSVKSASLEYVAEYQASELPAFEGLAAEEATALLNEWATTARPLSEQAAVVRDGVPVVSEVGSGSFDRAVESLVPSRDAVGSLIKSRSSCRKNCQRYLGGPGRFDVACVIAHVLICLGACYGAFGIGCVVCLELLGFDDKLCGYLGSMRSLFQYLRCYWRC